MTEKRESRDERDAEAAREAQATLDQIRTQAGGALSGRELLGRLGRKASDVDEDAPPLDWRLTPANVALQILAVAAFVAAFWFMGALVYDGIAAIFGAAGGGQ